VEIGETLLVALCREIEEELGWRCTVHNYLGAIECAWSAEGMINHEINHVFRIELPILSGSLEIASLEPDLEFLWVKVSDLPGYNLLPTPAIGLIQSYARGSNETWWITTSTDKCSALTD
jgi:8-oxo-dGTP pyrophosphatase MutT (NUDIX family)